MRLVDTPDIVGRGTAVNNLLKSGAVEMLQAGRGTGFILRLRDESKVRLENASTEEQVVFSLIEASQSKGIWIREIRDQSGLTDTQLKRVLKQLEQRKLVKAVKAVGTTKKCYMLFNIEADSSLTGGTFYSDGAVDSQFVQTLVQVSITMLQAQRKRVEELHPNDVMKQREESYVKLEDVARFIQERGICKVALAIVDVERLLDVAVLDGKLEKRFDRAYRALKSKQQPTALASVPCLQCPCDDYTLMMDNYQEQAEQLKKRGNECFKQKRYHNALRFYSEALELDVNPVILANRAQAYLNIGKLEKAYVDADAAVCLDASNLKALYRRAYALSGLGLYSRARSDLERCVKIDPSNADAEKLLESLKGKADKSPVDVTTFVKAEPLQSRVPLQKIRIDVDTTTTTDEAMTDLAKLNVAEVETGIAGVLANKPLPTPAKTRAEFASAVFLLRDSPRSFAEYFLTLDLTDFPALFGDIIESDTIEILANGLAVMGTPSARTLEALWHLSLVSRFDVAALFLSDAAKQHLRSLLDKHGPEHATTANAVRRAYFL
ncbi:RNA polymerase Rpc34 subunit family protein [Aphelenchoides avenae]|nr:RNA polymerase Rpc34 subunit family protein [Aphelenchus avenae]